MSAVIARQDSRLTFCCSWGKASHEPANRQPLCTALDTCVAGPLETLVHILHTNHTHARSFTNNRFRTEEGEESLESDQAEGFTASKKQSTVLTVCS